MRRTRLAAGFAALTLAAPGTLAANDPAAVPVACCPAPAPRTMDDLVRMGRAELEALFRASDVGTPPRGKLDGRAIFDPGTPAAVRKARRTSLVWQGKVVRDDGVMVNRVFGVFRLIPAKVFIADSYLDARPAVVFDYADTSKLFPDVRDEVRQVGPGLYLGVTYRREPCGPRITNFFALHDPNGCCK